MVQRVVLRGEVAFLDGEVRPVCFVITTETVEVVPKSEVGQILHRLQTFYGVILTTKSARGIYYDTL